ncbi:MAG TPA: single-stranded DNA-binding protein [Hyphomonadaceae bacterium]|jgi:single-strand DNA-binding protein|nr:single-stranded DNA-binding protein [Hyphomonadaceae bacterium]
MDRASFELIGNVGKLEIKPIKGDKNLAIVSVATSERWKAEGGDWTEKTYWHRVVVFAPAKVKLIEAAVQKGTRLRLVGQIRPGSWEDERGQTRYTVEFVVTGFGEVEILARGKPKAEAAAEEAPAGDEARKAKRKRAA